jgi:hypothetical protein
MSGSHRRWNLYGLTVALEEHTLPTSNDPDAHEGLAEAVWWLREHAPKSQALEHLERALRLMAQAREEFRHLEEQLTCVARSLEGDDPRETAVAEIDLFDRREFGEPDPWLDAPLTPEETEAVMNVDPNDPNLIPWE